MLSAPTPAQIRQRGADTLAGFEAKVEGITRQLLQAKAAIQNADAVVSGAGGIVTVDVTPDGRVRSLRLREDVGRLDGEQLSRAIVQTVREGTVRALETARRGTEAALGDGNPAAAVLTGRIDALSEPADPIPQVGDAPASGRVHLAGDDDRVPPNPPEASDPRPAATRPDDDEDDYEGPRDGRGL